MIGALFLAMLAVAPAHAADIVLAGYDRIRDELVVDVAYQGGDVAREDYVVRERFSLAGMPCSPRSTFPPRSCARERRE
jgi:hypothetical protein